jgi:hypothetical protein
MGTISIPWAPQGILELFSNPNFDRFVPIWIISAPSGGLLLLGYGTALYRYLGEMNGANFQNDNIPENSGDQKEEA